MELLLFGQPEGKALAKGARRVRHNVEAFRARMKDEIVSNGVSRWEPDCVDSIAYLVGDPNLAGMGPAQGWRHYSWSFSRVCAIGRIYARDFRDSSHPVNPKHAALPARDDHVIAICAEMVERNSVVVRGDAPRERRKQRDVTCTIDPEDQSAFCDVNVARNERVVRRPG